MKFVFSGWNRIVVLHEHNVEPVFRNEDGHFQLDKEGPIKWHSASIAYGKLKELELGGNFLVEMRFELVELKNWIERFVDEQPEAALKLLTEMQGKAVKAVLNK